jgi:hypothetical protein
MEWRVKWKIDIAAADPVEAAQVALETMRNPDSFALCFEVIDEDGDLHDVDLLNDGA